MSRTRSRVATLLLAFVVVACAQTPSSPPGRVEELLGLVPAAVGDERALYYSDMRAVRGFSSALPLAASGQVFGAPFEDFTDVLESGGQPLTLLAGEIDPELVHATVEDHGYRAQEDDGWVRFSRDGEVRAGAPPLVVAVPAGAARDGLLVLGSPEDVDAVVSGAAPPPWAGPLVQAVGGAGAIAFDGRQDRAGAVARRHGADVSHLLEQHRVSGSLAPYEAAAVSWDPRGEFDGVRTPAGVVALLLPEGADGHEQAAALALRTATAPVLGDGRRTMGEIVEGGAPRFDDSSRTVRLPVRWLDFDGGRFRRDLEAGDLLFLVPGETSR